MVWSGFKKEKAGLQSLFFANKYLYAHGVWSKQQRTKEILLCKYWKPHLCASVKLQRAGSNIWKWELTAKAVFTCTRTGAAVLGVVRWRIVERVLRGLLGTIMQFVAKIKEPVLLSRIWLPQSNSRKKFTSNVLTPPSPAVSSLSTHSPTTLQPHTTPT